MRKNRTGNVPQGAGTRYAVAPTRWLRADAGRAQLVDHV